MNKLKEASGTHLLNAFISDFDWFLVLLRRKHPLFDNIVDLA